MANHEFHFTLLHYRNSMEPVDVSCALFTTASEEQKEVLGEHLASRLGLAYLYNNPVEETPHG